MHLRKYDRLLAEEDREESRNAARALTVYKSKKRGGTTRPSSEVLHLNKRPMDEPEVGSSHKVTLST